VAEYAGEEDRRAQTSYCGWGLMVGLVFHFACIQDRAGAPIVLKTIASSEGWIYVANIRMLIRRIARA
jgi:hypothetical protein